jgi:hypothetical protein
MPEPEGIAMELIAARSGAGADDAAGCSAELRVVVLGGDFEFSDGVQGGVDDDDSQYRVAVVGPVQQEALYAVVRAVGVQSEAALGVLGSENVE